jgi:hypothetical protein
LNTVHGDVHSIQHYVIKFVSDMRQVDGFLQFPSPIKLTAMIYTKDENCFTIYMYRDSVQYIKLQVENIECPTQNCQIYPILDSLLQSILSVWNT